MCAKGGINVCLTGKCPEDQPKLNMSREEQSAYFDYHVQSLIAGSRKQLKREKMRFDISICTSRINSHAEGG